ncbi:hypothetical protein DSM106972_024370 [Dulcicalothrix desertica PCC 7102]|uniref:O-antigen polymerase n=1 Tax=Dulcicalothrix desertica PCC 7102 TaxID=232991 RepID=A0A3S1AR90_9CYAN|nr:hypothetical protein [Dulcicalothrix desertica]RUT07176.1 hypothetical protein DSM106972_024370 [Dulcicalothrix desertica PCC 7102]TWH61829.1 hypothetical protein CAL7102_00506 [Dulcicalothrix desertica PCC 7102]
MTQFLESHAQQLAYLPTLAHKQQRHLLRAFWIFTLGVLVYEIFLTETQSLLSNFIAVIITIAALLPSYLWCSGRAQGMPIFPFFALTFISTYAFPFITNHPVVVTYSPDSQLIAGITVSGFLGLGTFVWFHFVKSTPKAPAYYRALDSKKSDLLLLLVLIIGVLFNLANNGGWLFISDGLFSAVRSAVLGLNALAAFVLAYRLGSNELSKWQSQLFIMLMISQMLTSAIALVLVGATSTFIAGIIAFIIGRKKIPALPIVIVLVCLTLLHYGKADMRAKYWSKTTLVQPWEYPAWYSEWLGYSFDYLNKPDDLRKEDKSSLAERSSVVQMLLLAQDKSPDTIPYLYGKSYSILPQLIIPRFLNNNKIRSHEGTSILNIHYRLQTYAQAQTTTIGWDLLSESYANFGSFGCAGLAIFTGILCGQSTRWSTNAPILSAQSLFSVLMTTFTFQTEWTAGVFVSALFQSSMIIVGIVLFLMRTYKVVTVIAKPQKTQVKW